MVNIGVIGYGYWGPNIVRNFSGLTDCKIVAVCDKSPEALQYVLASYSGIECTHDARDIFMSKAIDAVAIVTPVSTHYELARQCLITESTCLSRSRLPRPWRKPRSSLSALTKSTLR